MIQLYYNNISKEGAEDEPIRWFLHQKGRLLFTTF